MNKKLKDVLNLEQLKLQADLAYEKYHQEVAKLFKEIGEGEHSFEIQEDTYGFKYIRLTLTDNIKRLNKGEYLVGISLIKPFGIKIDRLKNPPKLKNKPRG